MSDEPLNTEETCANCRYYLAQNHTTLCRRYPPSRHPGGLSEFVRTNPGYWCGEWASVTVYTPVHEPSVATPDEASVISSTADIPALFTGSSIEEELRSGRISIAGVSFEPIVMDQQILERNYTRADLIRNTADEDPNNQVVNVIEEDGFRTIQYENGRIQREWMEVEGTSERPVAVQTDHLGQEIIEVIEHDQVSNSMILHCVDGGSITYFLADRSVASSLLPAGERSIEEEFRLRDAWILQGQTQERERVLGILNGLLRENHGAIRTGTMTQPERDSLRDQNRWLASVIVRIGEQEQEEDGA